MILLTRLYYAEDFGWDITLVNNGSKRRIAEAFEGRFDNEGIEIAFPQIVLHNATTSKTVDMKKHRK
jgi:hypothetical protein